MDFIKLYKIKIILIGRKNFFSGTCFTSKIVLLISLGKNFAPLESA